MRTLIAAFLNVVVFLVYGLIVCAAWNIVAPTLRLPELSYLQGCALYIGARALLDGHFRGYIPIDIGGQPYIGEEEEEEDEEW